MGDEINRMFSKVSGSYDTMNHILSFGIDNEWRRDAAKAALMPQKRYRVIDLATGTGDLAIEVGRLAAKSGKDISITGSDFNREMLLAAGKKIRSRGIRNISLEKADAFNLKNKQDSFDVIVSGFGLRSFEFAKGGGGMRKFLSGARRILRKGGRIVLLDMAMPDDENQRRFFEAYSVVMKLAGSLVDSKTYSWLVETIRNFDKKKLVREMRSSGFRNVRIRALRSGIAFLVTAEK